MSGVSVEGSDRGKAKRGKLNFKAELGTGLWGSWTQDGKEREWRKLCHSRGVKFLGFQLE